MSKAVVESFFVSKIYRTDLAQGAGRKALSEIAKVCRSMAIDDHAGRAWCDEHSYPGYTSYASLNDLPNRFPEFADLKGTLDGHVLEFARTIDLDLGGRPLELDSLWVNILPYGGYHSAHIHPHSVVSGTYYVALPKGTSAIRFEDPRLPMMMAAPPRRAKARLENRTFATIEPREGTLLLWESWLRHEVPFNSAKGERISVSFNYRWG